jgi:hypothetical protein
MSYCRNNGKTPTSTSSGHAIREKRIFLQCLCGTRDKEGNYEHPFPAYTTRSGMIAHLRRHQERGDKVPGYTFERLEREILEHGDAMDGLDKFRQVADRGREEMGNGTA